MPEHLEKSTERLIKAIRSTKEWAERVLAELERSHAKYQEGLAEVARGIADLKERRATFIKESSVATDRETGQALDALTEHLERLLAEDDASKAGQTAPAPMPLVKGSPAHGEALPQGPVAPHSNLTDQTNPQPQQAAAPQPAVQQPVEILESDNAGDVHACVK